MAKKNAKKKSDDRTPRYGDLPEEKIREAIQDIREMAAELEAIVDEMHDAGIKSLKIDGITKNERALVLLREYSAKLQYELKRAIIKGAN